MIVLFPDHTHLLFGYKMASYALFWDFLCVIAELFYTWVKTELDLTNCNLDMCFVGLFLLELLRGSL